ncbi:hypothetical protein [Streptomyces sp. NPDC058751]|uniref:hypothetical protein n=1 Tax=Streptomyces sp. NPDC058751 TaxID=3346623 RepID=UPI003678A185
MRKLRNVAVLIAAIGGLGLVGGTAHAGGYDVGGDSLSVTQSSTCKSHDLNVDILGNVGIANGLGGNLLNGEGDPGGQATSLGSKQGCNNTFGG